MKQDSVASRNVILLRTKAYKNLYSHGIATSDTCIRTLTQLLWKLLLPSTNKRTKTNGYHFHDWTCFRQTSKFVFVKVRTFSTFGDCEALVNLVFRDVRRE